MRAPSTPARSIAPLIAALPSSCAGKLANAPLKAPTGVRVALTMTMSSFMRNSCSVAFGGRRRYLALPHPRQAMRVCQHDLSVEYRRQLALFRPFRKGRRAVHGAAAVPENAGPYERKLAMLKAWAGKRVIHMAEEKKEPVTIKKYANRRLYNTGTSTYVTLEDLAAMVKNGEDFIVYDAKSGEDITRSVLTQIIFEQENKEGGQNLLPIQFLRQLIRFYGDSMQMLVPRYLEVSLDSLTREQEKFRNH